MQKPEGSSVYLLLSTRSIPQIARADGAWEADAVKGGYWLRQPAPGAEAAIIFTGAIAPEALAAWDMLIEDMPGLGLLNITSPDLLHRGWSARGAARWTGETTTPSHVEQLLSALSPGAGLVTVIDGSPGLRNVDRAHDIVTGSPRRQDRISFNSSLGLWPVKRSACPRH